MLNWLIRSLVFLVLKAFFRFQIKGAEYIPKKGGFILASNHVSYLDPPVVAAGCPRRLSFMARHDLFFNRFFSWLISSAGAFAVKRNSADLSAMKEGIRRLKKGEALLLFPEGSRQEKNIPAVEPQAGIGFLVQKAGVPVIPVFVKGTEEALPKGAKFIKPAQVSVCFGRQIRIEGRMPYQDVAQLIMAGIRRLSKNIP